MTEKLFIRMLNTNQNKNKDADQLRGNREADQRLCFRYTDSTIPLLPKSEISNLLQFSVAVQPDLCRTWSETPKTGFLTTRLSLCFIIMIAAFINTLLYYKLEKYAVKFGRVIMTTCISTLNGLSSHH